MNKTRNSINIYRLEGKKLKEIVQRLKYGVENEKNCELCRK